MISGTPLDRKITVPCRVAEPSIVIHFFGRKHGGLLLALLSIADFDFFFAVLRIPRLGTSNGRDVEKHFQTAKIVYFVIKFFAEKDFRIFSAFILLKFNSQE